MYGAGPDVFAVWGYVIANTIDSQVELNPRLLAGILGCNPERITAAIDFLCAPDPSSRTKTDDGRRLIREGEFAYRVPNFAAYRAIRNEEERREYNREAKRRQRERDAGKVTADVNDSQRMSAMSAQAETETEAETEKTKTASATLAEHFTDTEHRAAYLAYRRAHRMADGMDASLRALESGMNGQPPIPWARIGAALVEMRAASVDFNPRAVTGFARKVGVPVSSVANEVRPRDYAEAKPLADKFCAECEGEPRENEKGRIVGLQHKATCSRAALFAS
jgi:hypothetical protein